MGGYGSGAGCGSPRRSHQLRMAVRSATLGTSTSGVDEEADAARSAATTTGSAISEPEIGQRNSSGGLAVNDDGGEGNGGGAHQGRPVPVAMGSA